MNVNRIVGLNVRAMRDAAELNQEQLAEMIGMDQGALSRKERGITAFSLEEIYAIADALDCEPVHLLPKRRQGDEWTPQEAQTEYFAGVLPEDQSVAEAVIASLREKAKLRERVIGRKAE